MKNLALFLSGAAALSLALFAGCSSTATPATDAGAADATPTDSAAGSVCDTKPTNVCPNETSNSASERAACLKEETGKCGATFTAFYKCILRSATCNDAGKLDVDNLKGCDAEGKAFSTCSAAAPPDAGPQPDAAPPEVNGCTSYVDRTGQDTELTWDLSFGTSANRCIKVLVGDSVSWKGDHTAHPVVPFNGLPIANVTEGTALSFVTPGVYGFKCSAHASMNGAIQVVPRP